MPEENKPVVEEKKKPAEPAKAKPQKKAKPAPPPLTPEEKRERDYEQACTMQDWVQWAVSYQDKVDFYRQAAEAFRGLGDYKDCPERLQECLDGAEHAGTVERDQSFEVVKQLAQQAKTADDYYYAEEKLAQFAGRPEADELICLCKCKRSKRVRFRRVLGLAIAVVFCACIAVGAHLWKTTALQYHIANYYMSREDYAHALSWYLRARNYKDTEEKIVVCRYERGQEFFLEGKYEQAYQKFRIVGGYEDADQMAEQCFVAALSESKPGDIVKFGKDEAGYVKWLVLDRDDEFVTMIAEFDYKHAFDKEGNNWAESELRVWLDTEFLSEIFADYEIERLSGPVVEAEDGVSGVSGGANTSDPVYILSASEAEQYLDLLAGKNDKGKPIDKYKATEYGWWLRTPGDGETGQAVFQKNGTVDYYGRGRSSDQPRVRPVITVSLK